MLEKEKSNRTDSPRVSVIMIFLDGKSFLEEAIESVIAQTYGNWELLLVDDGSGPRATAIAKVYTEQYPRKIRYLEHPGHINRGMSATRNLGTRYARGEFIALIDADDVWLPSKLADHIAILDGNLEVGMVCGATISWNSWSNGLDYILPTGHKQDVVIYPPDAALALYPLGKATSPSFSDVVFRSDLVMRLGGFEEQFTGFYEDLVFLSKVYLATPVYFCSEPSNKYRRHPASCNAGVKKAGTYHHFRRHFLEWFEQYLKMHEKVDRRVASSLSRALMYYRNPRIYYLLSLPEKVRNRCRRLASRVLSRRGAKRVLPRAIVRSLQRIRGRTSHQIPLGSVRFGDFGRLLPIGRDFGSERGTPIDRYYIEEFLSRNAGDIQGRVLEADSNSYTLRFGGNRVKRSDILSVETTNLRATIVGDLAHVDTLPEAVFDCIVLTQVLQCVYDLHAGVTTLYRALKPGGVLLVTAPGVTSMQDVWPWYWAFSPRALRVLLEGQFGRHAVWVELHGNVFAASAFLYGIAFQECDNSDLNVHDPRFPLIVAARAIKRRDE